MSKTIMCSVSKNRWDAPEAMKFQFDGNYQPLAGDIIMLDGTSYIITARVWVNGYLTLEAEVHQTGIVPA